MAAVSEVAGSRTDFFIGNKRAVSAHITSLNDGDTWVPGLSIIESITFVQDGDYGNIVFGFSINNASSHQAIITYNSTGGTGSGFITAIGS